MISLTKWIVLSIVILFSWETITASDDLSRDEEIREEYSRAVEMLKRNRTLINQERKRWSTIHSDPVPDSLSVSDDGKAVTIELEIDTGVSNAINSQPIKRTITLTREERVRLPLDMSLCASLALRSGFRPSIGIGLPLRKMIPIAAIKPIGFGVYTTFYAAGVHVYYRLDSEYRYFPGVSFHLLLGSDWDGKPAPGVAIGTTF